MTDVCGGMPYIIIDSGRTMVFFLLVAFSKRTWRALLSDNQRRDVRTVVHAHFIRFGGILWW